MKSFKSYITEGRPSQRHPLEGHEYHRKTDAELVHIAKDAHKAAEAMKSHNTQAENKYRDQANDSATVRYFRQKNGMPDWYKKKYGHMKEDTEQVDERCWPGYKPVPGKKAYSSGSCVKEEGYGNHPSQRVDPRTGKKYVPPKSPLSPLRQGVAEAVDIEDFVNDMKKKFPNAKVSTPESRAKDAEEVKKRHEAAAKKPVAPRPASPPAYPLGGWDRKSGRSYSEGVELEEAIPKSTGHALIHSSSRKIVAKGNKAEMMKKMKELNAKEKNSHHLGMTNRGKVGDTFGEEVELDEVAAWQRKEGKNPEGGLNQKGVESYRRENPGSKLQTAVTTKPSKLDPDSKSAKRRKSFCARMGGMKKRLTSAKTANDPDSRINKALRKWNC
jgi:hypothetical protein